MSLNNWGNADKSLEDLVDSYRDTCLSVYEHDPNRIVEDLRKEFAIAEGGYGRKQIQELLQNGADAMREAPGRLAVYLTKENLYVANQGEPFTESGLRAILYAHLSEKTGEEIGRFGLGFKSVAGISTNPQIFSRSVSFAFDRSAARDSISKATRQKLYEDEVPSLRLAWPIEPTQEFRDDPELRVLAKWATTIVKVPLHTGVCFTLDEEMRNFDESFCLFVPAVKELRLDSQISGMRKSFTTSRTGEGRREVELRDSDGQTSRWYVVSKKYQPSKEALESAGRTARRDNVTVSWAVPLDGKAKLGQLSAYFPVKSEVSLSGKLNAPWKLSDDRIDLIEDDFNREILETVVPELVGEARQFLGPLDPGRYIDILPARGRETRSWADGVINEPIYRHLRSLRSLPNGELEMRSPNSLRLVPSVVPDVLIDEWMEIAEVREDWLHPACASTPERKSKSIRLMGFDPSNPIAHLRTWFESFVAHADSQNAAAKSIAAIRTMNAVYDEVKPQDLEGFIEEVRLSPVVLLENGTWARPERGQAVIRSSTHDSGTNFVHPALTEDPQVESALRSFGVTTFENTGNLEDVLNQLRNRNHEDNDEFWLEAWSVFRSKNLTELRTEFFDLVGDEMSDYIRVLNLAGKWVLPAGQYIPGNILRANTEDAHLLVDPTFHALDSELLRALGISDKPFHALQHTRSAWVEEFLAEHREEFGNELGLNPRNWTSIKIREATFLGPLDHLAEFSPQNRARLVLYLINHDTNTTVEIGSEKSKLTAQVVHPNVWKVVNDGLVKTSLGYTKINESVYAPDEAEEISSFTPTVLDVHPESYWLEVLPFIRSIHHFEIENFETLVLFHRGHEDEVSLGKTYAWYADQFPDDVPPLIHVHSQQQWHKLPASDVAVASDELEEDGLEKFGIPTLPVPERNDAQILKNNWGLLTAEDIPSQVDFDPTEEKQPLLLKFPNLLSLSADFPDDPVWERVHDLEFQACQELSMVSMLPGRPRVRESLTRLSRDNVLYVEGESSEEQWRGILALLNLDLDDYRFQQLLDETHSQQVERAKALVRNASSDAEKIASLFSEDVLVALIPNGALSYAQQKLGTRPSHFELAQTCLDMYGTGTLEKLCRACPDLPVGQAPKTWRGSYGARKWVRELGFGDEWAGQTSKKSNAPYKVVSGPASIGAFHDYQAAVSRRLRQMLRRESSRRGLITLPTGAGKTRVAVQTIIESIADGDLDRHDQKFNGPILWLVDNEELCEQAISAWKSLWAAVGRINTSLTISRHFGNVEADEEPDGVQVVVATYQKTVRSVGKDDFNWLRESPLLVIDEAHTSLSPSYTKILEWTGRSRYQREKLLLGLTATPYRGSSDSDETKRLLRRFDGNILDAGVFGDEDPMVRLQNDRVLAHVTMEKFKTDTSVEMSENDIRDFREKHWLPSKKAEELGQDFERTMRIVRSIESKPDDWSIIVFAASVENAETIATILTLDGIPAASISSSTPDEERTLAFERFRAKELRVLTNYNVLSQGFDAPKTDAVYITRPTQSEVRYQQMIGRGLRGPKNGGTENVHIVNVLDNIEQFPLSIVYTPFEKLADKVNET